MGDDLDGQRTRGVAFAVDRDCGGAYGMRARSLRHEHVGVGVALAGGLLAVDPVALASGGHGRSGQDVESGEVGRLELDAEILSERSYSRSVDLERDRAVGVCCADETEQRRNGRKYSA